MRDDLQCERSAWLIWSSHHLQGGGGILWRPHYTGMATAFHYYCYTVSICPWLIIWSYTKYVTLWQKIATFSYHISTQKIVSNSFFYISFARIVLFNVHRAGINNLHSAEEHDGRISYSARYGSWKLADVCIEIALCTENGHEDGVLGDLDGSSSDEVDWVEDVTGVYERVTGRCVCRLELERQCSQTTCRVRRPHTAHSEQSNAPLPHPGQSLSPAATARQRLLSRHAVQPRVVLVDMSDASDFGTW